MQTADSVAFHISTSLLLILFPPAGLAAQPESLIISAGGFSASIAANNPLLRSDSVASWPSDQRMSHSRCVCVL